MTQHPGYQEYIEKTVRAIVDQETVNQVLCKVILTSKGAYVLPVKEREREVIH